MHATTTSYKQIMYYIETVKQKIQKKCNIDLVDTK